MYGSEITNAINAEYSRRPSKPTATKNEERTLKRISVKKVAEKLHLPVESSYFLIPDSFRFSKVLRQGKII